MPTDREILTSLATSANQFTALAVAWHGASILAVLALLLGWRPGQRTIGLLLAALVLSVAAVAIAVANPFNALAFASLTLILAGLALRLSGPVEPGAILARAAGWLMIAFGLVYPHFREDWTSYLFAAPTGVIPCPTLSVVVGVSLLSGSLGSRAWCVVVALAGALYGSFGVFRLGVGLDAVLLAGSFALASLGLPRRTATAVHPAAQT